ncbi:MAG TPA: leucyl aminopeptidase [Thermoanaerobaculia bacterium]|nr:leucyl aminopeptidase [Thermoanaerobaculia bacterium]
MTDIASVHVASRERPEADHLVVGCFEGEAPDVSGLAEGVREAIGRLSGRTGWRGKDEQLAQTDTGPDSPVVSLLGMGAKKDLTYAKLSRWICRLAEDARVSGARRLAIVVPAHAETTGGAAERVLRGLALSVYRYDRWQSEGGKGNGNRLESVAVVPPSGQEEAYRESLARSQPVAEAVSFVRTLGNAPANVATPAWMEERARELAESRGLEITVLQTEELEKRGMGGLLAVGLGAAVPPRMVRIDVGKEGPVVALVGKGITFDSGGISIKPAADMDDMKYDKCGACAVLGVAQAVADLGLPVRLRVYAPFAENALGSRAYRPSDILRCYNGKTVEVTNTDCEGRLILADALSWAAEEEPEAIVELSTLTGACVVALGNHAGGLFTPDDELAGELAAAAASAGERLWRLPLYPEFLEEMKGTHADLKNCSGRWGGANTAAAFLSQFVGETRRWAHLDIAGVAYTKNDHSPCPGATGFGVALTVDWLRRLLG